MLDAHLAGERGDEKFEKKEENWKIWVDSYQQVQVQGTARCTKGRNHVVSPASLRDDWPRINNEVGWSTPTPAAETVQTARIDAYKWIEQKYKASLLGSAEEQGLDCDRAY